MTNLWEETLEVLRDHGKTFEGVRYIQGSDFKITKEKPDIFSETYEEVEYLNILDSI